MRIFAVAADGDTAPKRIIKGDATGLRFPSGLLVATPADESGTDSSSGADEPDVVLSRG